MLHDAVDVPRVDEECAREDLRRAGELGEEERPAPATGQPWLRLAEDELLRDEVHPVAERRDHHHVRAPVERDERGLRDVAVDVLDRRRPGSREAPVDARDEELDLVALRAVLGAVEARGDDHLDQRRRPRAIGVLLEEALERVELLRDPLRVVEALDAEDEPTALVLLLEIGEESLGLGLGDHLAKAVDVDADRVDADADATPVELEPVGLGVDPEHPQARRAEVTRVVADLEAHVVGAEDAAQQLLALRKQPVHLRRRERDVEEEADREPRRARSQHRGHEHEVEVVDPDPRVGLAVREDRLGEALVHLDVALPRLGRDPQPVGEVVEERPERVVADLPVEVLLLLGREEDGVEVVLREPGAHALLERGRNDGPGPADPGRVAPERRERGRQPAGRALHLHRRAVDRQARRQPVARDDEPVVSALACQLSSFEPAPGRYKLRVSE